MNYDTSVFNVCGPCTHALKCLKCGDPVILAHQSNRELEQQIGTIQEFPCIYSHLPS